MRFTSDLFLFVPLYCLAISQCRKLISLLPPQKWWVARKKRRPHSTYPVPAIRCTCTYHVQPHILLDLIISNITPWMRSIAPSLLTAVFLLLVPELMSLLRLVVLLLPEFWFCPIYRSMVYAFAHLWQVFGGWREEVRLNMNSYDWLTTYEFVCGNSHVLIPSINDGALFWGGCEETWEDAIFFMCEGRIRVEQILAWRNRRFRELSPFLIFFGIQTSGWIFGVR